MHELNTPKPSKIVQNETKKESKKFEISGKWSDVWS